jgi:hypothetical protein
LGLKQPLKPKEFLEKWGGGEQATHYFATWDVRKKKWKSSLSHFGLVLGWV